MNAKGINEPADSERFLSLRLRVSAVYQTFKKGRKQRNSRQIKVLA
jgi:hypothetical protein